MKNVLRTLIVIAVVIISSCSQGNKEKQNMEGVHEVVVKEVLQAKAYTYLKVIFNGNDQWIAVSKIEAQPGEKYYFKDYMDMQYFESKDLGRVFESVFFVEVFVSDIKDLKTAEKPMMHGGHMGGEIKGERPNIEKQEISISPAEGGITIAELFTNKDKYNGKKVIIRGKVVKANMGIMNTNWYHLQDGTNADEKFDITISSLEENIAEGDTVTFEGTVVLDKDFGYGYLYDVLVEDAKKIE